MTTNTEFSFCEANGFLPLIFDWDGVLLDSGPAYYVGYERVLGEAGIATSPREIYLREGEPTAQLLAHMFEARCTPVNHLRAVETLGLAPRQCLVMENAPFAIEAAHGAGCPAIAICTTLPADDRKPAGGERRLLCNMFAKAESW